MKYAPLRITNGNCKMPCSDILGYTKPCSGLRPLQGFVPPHFCSPGLATQALIRAAKTSVTCNVIRNALCLVGKQFKIKMDFFIQNVYCTKILKGL